MKKIILAFVCCVFVFAVMAIGLINPDSNKLAGLFKKGMYPLPTYYQVTK